MKEKTEKEWQEELDAESFDILRKKGTERPFSGKFNDHFEKGEYVCKGCGEVLFASGSKFNAHCGWPAFDRSIAEDAITETRDTSHGMVRTEICCSKCGGHLGHVFDDGPTETGLRYCVNSLSLDFKKDQ
ncbi:MAG: peptide-methionine (R)-S-oxide reductase MsrB [Flavobacteriales bacterium]|nr:peptide-methionine (R)-S-oxide reductase MsrB [Flavobacteriales bacterium]